MCGILVFLLILPASVMMGSVAGAPSAGRNKSHQLVGAFFCPSFGHYRHWNLSGYQPPKSWASNFLPSIFNTRDPAKALYNSNDTSVILWQLAMMRQAGLDFAVAKWPGRNSYEDKIIRKIITEVMPNKDNPYPELRWSFLYEREKTSDPSVEEIVADLRYLAATYRSSKSILREHGRIVLFVSGSESDQADYAERWDIAADSVGGFYVVLKVFPEYAAFARKADAWFQFAPANRFEFDHYFSGYVSPGFSKYDEATPRLTRSQGEFAMALHQLKESNVRYALIETWNDWNEGTQVEPGTDMATGEDYGNAYVNLIRQIMKDETYMPIQQPIEYFGMLILAAVAILLLGPSLFRRRLQAAM